MIQQNFEHGTIILQLYLESEACEMNEEELEARRNFILKQLAADDDSDDVILLPPPPAIDLTSDSDVIDITNEKDEQSFLASTGMEPVDTSSSCCAPANDAREESASSAKEESASDAKEESAADVREESAADVKEESTTDAKEESAADVKEESPQNSGLPLSKHENGFPSVPVSSSDIRQSFHSEDLRNSPPLTHEESYSETLHEHPPPLNHHGDSTLGSTLGSQWEDDPSRPTYDSSLSPVQKSVDPQPLLNYDPPDRDDKESPDSPELSTDRSLNHSQASPAVGNRNGSVNPSSLDENCPSESPLPHRSKFAAGITQFDEYFQETKSSGKFKKIKNLLKNSPRSRGKEA